MPNGGRIYYLNRSQPPFLTQMIFKYRPLLYSPLNDFSNSRYFKATNDLEFVKQALPILDIEHGFWMNNTNTAVEVLPGVILNRYFYRILRLACDTNLTKYIIGIT